MRGWVAGVAAVVMACAPVAKGQLVMGPQELATKWKDTSILKPVAGAKVSILEFEDLECPMCAQAYPIVREAVAKYHIPLERHDFLISYHVWSGDAAVTARYLEDKVSRAEADSFRGDVFAAQNRIATREDLAAYTRVWFRRHALGQPFVIDPKCRVEVNADCALGLRMGLGHTPTLVVVSKNEWVEVTDPHQLYAAIDRVEAAVRAGR